MLITSDEDVPRVTIVVVALGASARLKRALESLTGHESRVGFDIVCVVNPHTSSEGPIPRSPGTTIVEPALNLGWAGGIQLGRTHTDAEFLVWVQDDQRIEPGWLDALVDAADAHPEVAAFGSTMIDDDGRVAGYNAGRADPPDDVSAWNATDTTRDRPLADVEEWDWVTSKGMLVRVGPFDQIHGPDPRWYPLNHVDKDYCTHLRAHGWRVALVAGARIRHEASQSAPTSFRQFLAERHQEIFQRAWAEPVRQLATGREQAEHPCATWLRGTDVMASVERSVGIEASRMLVEYSKWESRHQQTRIDEARRLARAESDRAAAEERALLEQRMKDLAALVRR